MKNIRKVRRATTAAMDSPYREGFDAGRNGQSADTNPYTGGLDIERSSWSDGHAKGYALWLQCQQAKGA